MKRKLFVLLVALDSLCNTGQVLAEKPLSQSAPDGWQMAAPREEIRPQFSFDPKGGADGQGGFIIKEDAREGLDGY